MSKSREALVGAAGMNDKKRGLSHETTAVDSLSTKSFSTWAASLPSGPHQPGQLGVERLDEAAEVEGDRVHGQPFPARRQDEVGHRLVVVEHVACHQAGASSGSRGRPLGGAPGLLGPAGHLVRRGARLGRHQRDVVELGLGPPADDLHPDGDAVDGDLPERRGRPASAPRRWRGCPSSRSIRWISARWASTSVASVRTWRTWPGRPFFMVTGLTQASSAPASSAADDGETQLLSRDVVEVRLEQQRLLSGTDGRSAGAPPDDHLGAVRQIVHLAGAPAEARRRDRHVRQGAERAWTARPAARRRSAS